MRARGIGNPARGVTLVEVLVAVAVLSIALIGLLRALDSQTAHTGAMLERTLAHWAALNAVEEARLAGAPGEAESETTADMGAIEWRVTLLREAGPFGLTRLEARAAAPTRAGAVVVGFLPAEDGS